MWITIPIKRTDGIKSEILLIKKSELELAKKKQGHLEKCLKPMIPNTFNWDEDNSVLCLSEHQESTDSFFSDKNIATQLYSIRSIIKTLHLNDRKLYSNFDFELKIQLSAISRHIKFHGQAMEVIFKLVDFLANEHKFTVSQKAQVKI